MLRSVQGTTGYPHSPRRMTGRVKEGPTYALISNPPNGCENWRRVGVRKEDKKGETRGACGDGVGGGWGGRGRSVG